MTQKEFGQKIAGSAVIVLLCVCAIVAFTAWTLAEYTPPGNENTYTAWGRVTDVYFARRPGEVSVDFEDGETLYLVSPIGAQKLYETIGYDIEELSDLLEGKVVTFRSMDRMDWLVELSVDGITVDNSKLTTDQCNVTRVCIVILDLGMLAAVAAVEVDYLKTVRKKFNKAEKKRTKKKKREQLENKR